MKYNCNDSEKNIYENMKDWFSQKGDIDDFIFYQQSQYVSEK